MLRSRMVDPVEATLRARMRALAQKGGAVTKHRHGSDPRYYRDVGRLGGLASVAARKARVAAELDGVKAIAEPIDAAPDTHATARRPVKITELLAERKRCPRRREVSERQRILDAIAQEHLARVIAGVYDANEPEPWDPWS